MTRPNRLKGLLTLFGTLCWAWGIHADETTPTALAAPATPVCSVITVAPGDGLDALFGHTAIRIQDPRLQGIFGAQDVWFDYGVFNPGDPETGEITVGSALSFVVHYAKGDANYLLMAADPEDRLAGYAQEGRQVFEQPLDLQPEEIVKLEDYLIDNLRHPEYAYRFLDDNCTTRAVKAIEWARGSKLESIGSATYRHWTDLYLSRQPLVQLGANWLMGSHAEKTTQIFLPFQLHTALTLEKLKKATPPPPPSMRGIQLPPTFSDKIKLLYLKFSAATPPLLLVFLGGFLVCLVSTLYRHRKRIPLPTRAYLDALLFAKIGAIGCLMTFLGFWSHHPELGAFNWNLIWCWPTHVVFAFFLLFCAHGKTTRTYARVAAIGAGFAALAYFFVPQALPVPLFPVVLLLALRAWRIGFHREAVIVPGQG